MDLQTEYSQRHRLNIVVGSPDSYLFFKSEGALYAATISHRPRTITWCSKCSSGLLAMELWSIRNHSLTLFRHQHISPDEDIIKIINNCPQFLNKEIEIIRFKGDDDLVNLVWSTMGNKAKNTKKEIFESIRKQTGDSATLSLIINTITFRKSPLLFDVTKDT